MPKKQDLLKEIDKNMELLTDNLAREITCIKDLSAPLIPPMEEKHREGIADITKGLYSKALFTTDAEKQKDYIKQIIANTLGAGAELNYNDAILFLRTYKSSLFSLLPYLKKQYPKSQLLELISKIEGTCDIALSNSILDNRELTILKTLSLYSYLLMENINRYSYIATLINEPSTAEYKPAKHTAGFIYYVENHIELKDKTALTELLTDLKTNFCLINDNAKGTIIPLFYSDKQLRLLKTLHTKEKQVLVNGFTKQDLYTTEKREEPIYQYVYNKEDNEVKRINTGKTDIVVYHKLKDNLTKEQLDLDTLYKRTAKEVTNIAIAPPFLIAEGEIYNQYKQWLTELFTQKQKTLKQLVKGYDAKAKSMPFNYILRDIQTLCKQLDFEKIIEKQQEVRTALSQAVNVFARDKSTPTKYTPTDKASKGIVDYYSKYITNEVADLFTVGGYNYTVSIDQNIKNQRNRALADIDRQILNNIFSICIKRESLSLTAKHIYEELIGSKDTKGNIKPDNPAIKLIESRIDNIIRYYYVTVDCTPQIIELQEKSNRATTLASKNRLKEQINELEQINKQTRKQPLMDIGEEGQVYIGKQLFKYWELNKPPVLQMLAAYKKQILKMSFEDFGYKIADTKAKGGVHRTLEQFLLKQNVIDAINVIKQMRKQAKYKNKECKILYAQIIDKRERTTNDGELKKVNGKYDYTVAADIKANKRGKYARYIKYINLFLEELKEVGFITSYKINTAYVTKGRAYKEGFTFTYNDIEDNPPVEVKIAK